MPQEGAPLCVEISLKSPENDSTIIVENWSMSLDTSKIDPSARATAVVYPKMGVILKSLLCVSRLLPACGLSRQLYDDWHICYRIMTGPLDKSSLGPDPESVEIGHCGSQCGRLSLSVDYRKTIDTFQRLEEGNEESVTFLHEELDGGQATRHLPGRPIPFANQGLYNDEEIESIQVQHFSQVMKYEKQTSLAPSLTPSLTPQVSGSPLNETSSIQVRKTSPALRDEFIHLNVTVKPAFASECSPNNNIGQFFEECRNPPSLDMFRSSNIVDINTALVRLQKMFTVQRTYSTYAVRHTVRTYIYTVRPHLSVHIRSG
jgi:hypothetical protein